MSDKDMIAKARKAMAAGASNATQVGAKIGVNRHVALRLMRKVKAEIELENARNGNLPVLTGVPAGLSFYDGAKHLLAIAKSLDEVMELADTAAAMAEYRRRAKDRQLQIDATEIVILAERRLGQMLASTDRHPPGRNRKGTENSSAPEPNDPPTLKALGIDKKLSSRAQKLASLSERAIEARLKARREGIERDNDRITASLLKQKSGSTPRARDRAEPDDSADFFPTPPWATRALIEYVFRHAGFWHYGDMIDAKYWEPACGEGHMSEVLSEYFREGLATDVHEYSHGNELQDFLADGLIVSGFDWIITNPPFKNGMAEKFTLRALDLAREGVAMFVSLQFLESIGRYEQVFKDRPPTIIAFFAERVPICKGRWDPDASSDAAYIWLVWIKDHAPMAPMWIPPGCRGRLTKPSDRERFAAWSLPKKEDGENDPPHDPETGVLETEAAE
jgi:hypothetical protein